jgi:hypothetical protein
MESLQNSQLPNESSNEYVEEAKKENQPSFRELKKSNL